MSDLIFQGPNTATIGEGGANTWELEDLQAKDVEMELAPTKATTPKRKVMHLPQPQITAGMELVNIIYYIYIIHGR